MNTQRLTIRPLKLTDLEDMHRYRSEQEVAKYQGFEPMSVDEVRAFIAEQITKSFGRPGQWIQYGIELKATGKLIGDCAIKLQQHDPRIADVGITISHHEQQKAYGKETMNAILAFLFQEHGIHRIVATVDAENLASIKLFQSIGFRQEAHFVDSIFFKGKWGSEYQFAMLKREWDNFQNNY